nr:hypothetical protein [Tanacetum cinerariifolium]
MSSTSSAVTYTSIYTDSEPGRVFWGADEELSDGGSPRVIVYGYDGLPMRTVAPPSPDYIPGPEEPQTPPVPHDEDEREPMFIQPHDPDYVPEPIYPEYIPLKDEHVLLAEEQPLPLIDLPTAELLGYVAESDPEEDPEEYKDDETEDGPVDYPMDGGDDDDGDSSGDDANDEDEDEEQEHLGSANSAIVILTVELVSPPEGTEPVIPPPSTNTTTTGARIITLRMASTQALIVAITAALPSPPLPPPLYIPSPVDRRDDILETEMSSRKRLCLSTLGSRYEIGESSTARPTGGRGIDYRYIWVDPAEAVSEIAPMTIGEDSRTRISQRVTMDSQWVDLLMEDRTAHQEAILIMEEEAYAAREAWGHSIGLSQAVHSELQTHREQTQHQLHETRFQMQQAEITEHQETDRRHQAQMVETLLVMGDMRREIDLGDILPLGGLLLMTMVVSE